MILQTISQSGADTRSHGQIAPQQYATQPVVRFATEEQRKRMLPRLISGEFKACFGVIEPRSGAPYNVSSMIKAIFQREYQHWFRNVEIEDICRA